MQGMAKEIDWEKLKYGASLGLTLDQLAAYCCGVSVKTFFRYRQEDDRIDRVIAEGLSEGIIEMSEIVFRRARAGEVKPALEYLKSKAGWASKAPETLQVQPQLNIYMSPPQIENSGNILEAEDSEDVKSLPSLNITLT